MSLQPHKHAHIRMNTHTNTHTRGYIQYNNLAICPLVGEEGKGNDGGSVLNCNHPLEVWECVLSIAQPCQHYENVRQGIPV